MTLGYLWPVQGLVLMNRGKMAVVRRSPRGRAQRTHRDRFYDRVWREAARELGAQVQQLSRATLQISKGGICTRVSNNTTEIDSFDVLQIAGDKPYVYKLLARRNTPVPRHLVYTLDELQRAQAFLSTANGRCVVK